MDKIQINHTLTDINFMELVLRLKLHTPHDPLFPVMEHYYDDGVLDYSFIVTPKTQELTYWDGEQYRNVEFTYTQIEHLRKLVEVPKEEYWEPWHPYRDGSRYEG